VPPRVSAGEKGEGEKKKKTKQGEEILARRRAKGVKGASQSP